MDGDIRAIHLLQWAGMVTHLEIETVVWALQHAGGNRGAVVTHLLRLIFHELTDSEARKLGRALSSLRDDAVQDGDQAKLEFFHFVRNSEILKSARNLYV